MKQATLSQGGGLHMRKVLKIFMVLMMLVGLIGTAHADTSILYFNDGVTGTDQMAAALATLAAGYSVTTAASLEDFATQIATPGAYNLGIFMRQTDILDDSAYTTAINALGAFVAAGGRSIYTDIRMDNDMAALFAANWTSMVTKSRFDVTLSPLAAGITNPVGLDPSFYYLPYFMGVDGPVLAATYLNSDGTLSPYGAIVIGSEGRCISNGFFPDMFVDGSTGVQLYLNEIQYLADPVPLPGAVWLLGSGLLGLALFRGRMRED
jgi:hypothetical protein